MAPSFAELKEKASKAKDAGVTKFQNTRDRHTSVPMAKTNWDPYSGKPPPPPPPPAPRASNSARTSYAPPPARTSSAVPPPVVRTSRPAVPAENFHQEHRDEEGEEEGMAKPEIDWANLSPEDKQVFFSWLDEFFDRFFNLSVPLSNRETLKPVVGTIPRSTAPLPPPSRGPPPKIAKSSRPLIPATSTGTTSSNDFTLSYPPPATHGSFALDLAHYFAPSTHWPTPWYSSKTLPPPLEGNTKFTYASAWQSSGQDKTVCCGVLFSDLSFFWGSINFSTSAQADPNDGRQVKRDAVYLPRPKALGKEPLMEAHSTYGETIASFAESFVGGTEYCARGECWDLANEALKYFDQFDYVPKPVPSISRTHGHLIYEGKGLGKGQGMMGRWRGRDDRVRRGDIVEWRRVRIAIYGAAPGSYSTLGDPDHTAVVVRETAPRVGVEDGRPLSPEELGSLEVVEQSVGQLPDRRVYDLRGFEEGEMWIYRPVGLEAYLGVQGVTAKCPESLVGVLRI